MYKLNFYVPESHLEIVKQALFEKGAGRYEGYDQWCGQILGEGQFRPLDNSQPFIGQNGTLEKVAEYKVEMICPDAEVKEILQTLVQVHPYEQPAYDLSKIITLKNL